MAYAAGLCITGRKRKFSKWVHKPQSLQKKEILESAVLASNHFQRYVQQTVSISGAFNQIFNQ